jgi:hypothetical protein
MRSTVISAAGPLAVLAHYILVPYRNCHPLSGPLYRLVATARSRGYHSGWLSAPAGPSDLLWKLVAALEGSSNRCSRGIPAVAPTAGLCGLLAAAPRLPKQSTWRYRLGGDDHCVDPSWQRSPPWAPRTHTPWATRLGAVARRPGPGEHRGRRRMPTAGEHKRP